MAGLADRVEFCLRDYREEHGRYDRIVSVGMFEHVGVNHYKAFFSQLKSLLAPDGVALLHSIGRMDGPGSTNPWIRKYIFPGGYMPALSEVLPVVERSKLWVTDVEILRLHYAETLRSWRHRFERNRDRLRAMYDERFCRMWEMYLVGSEVAFRHGGHHGLPNAACEDNRFRTDDAGLHARLGTRTQRPPRALRSGRLSFIPPTSTRCESVPRFLSRDPRSDRCYFAGRMETTTTSRVTPLRDPEPRAASHPALQRRRRAGTPRGDLDQQRRAIPGSPSFFRPEHFGNAVHGRIFAAIGKLIERGQIARPGHAQRPVRPGHGIGFESADRNTWRGSPISAVTIINAEITVGSSTISTSGVS